MALFFIGFAVMRFTDDLPVEVWIGLSLVEGLIELIIAVLAAASTAPI